MRRIVLIVCLLAAIALLLAHFLSGRSALGDIIDELWPVYMAIAAGLVFLCLFFNAPRRIGWQGTAASLLTASLLIYETEFWELGPLDMEMTAAAPNGDTLSVATFNVWASNQDLNATTTFILEHQFDLVSAQEVGLNSGELPDRLRAEYPHQFTCGRGVYIFSRRSFLDTGCPDTPQGLSRRMPVAWADIEWNDGEVIRFVAVHLARPMEMDWRRPQIERLADFLAANSDRTMILAGDFNAGHAGRSMEGLEAQLAPMRRADDRHPTWPSNRFGGVPLLALDQLWLSEDLMMLYSHRGPDLGSDHRPVIGEVAKRHWPGNAEEVQ